MPELPAVTVYRERLDALYVGHVIEEVQLLSPFVVRTVKPSLKDIVGHELTGTRRMGKRLVLELDGGLYLVLHLMIAGRLRMRDLGSKPNRRLCLVSFVFDHCQLWFTEASKKRRTSSSTSEDFPAPPGPVIPGTGTARSSTIDCSAGCSRAAATMMI